MTYGGGVKPYSWSWAQAGGTQASLSDTALNLVTVDLPVVSTTETLLFEATLTDANGTQRTAQASVQVTPEPLPSTGDIPLLVTPLSERLIISGERVTILNTMLSNLTVAQTSGPAMTVETVPAGSGFTDIAVTAPALKKDSAHATFEITGLDAQGATITQALPVVVVRPPSLAPAPAEPPQVLPPQRVPRHDDPLIFSGGAEGLVVSEGDNVNLAANVAGGKGSSAYQYEWTYLKVSGGPDIRLGNADSRVATFEAPAVSGPTLLQFHVHVDDGAQNVERNVLVQVNDLAPTLNVGTLTPMTVDSGQLVSISAPSPTGGVQFPHEDHYHYFITQVHGSAATLQGADSSKPAERQSNWTFTAPTLAVGAADDVLEFQILALDRVGNSVAVSQVVTVSAPPIPTGPPPVAAVSLPSVVKVEDLTVTLQGRATAGTPPYQYGWEIHPIISATPAITAGDIQATGNNPVVTLPDVDPYNRVFQEYKLAVTLSVTDSVGRVAQASGDIQVNTDLNLPGTDALQCGDLPNQVPCTDLDLVLAMTFRCPDTLPYAMNDIIKIGDRVLEFRRCVNAREAYRLYTLDTAGRQECLNFDPSANTGDITCHLACYSDGCNTLTNPPANTLFRPEQALLPSSNP